MFGWFKPLVILLLFSSVDMKYRQQRFHLLVMDKD